MEGKPKQAKLSASAAKAAAAAGVKPAALITRINPHDHSLPKPAFELSEKKLDPKAPVKKAAKPILNRIVAKTAPPKKESWKHAAQASHHAASKPIAKKPSTTVSANAVRPSSAVPKPSAGQH
jgi:hypothetical protein